MNANGLQLNRCVRYAPLTVLVRCAPWLVLPQEVSLFERSARTESRILKQFAVCGGSSDFAGVAKLKVDSRVKSPRGWRRSSSHVSM